MGRHPRPRGLLELPAVAERTESWLGESDDHGVRCDRKPGCTTPGADSIGTASLPSTRRLRSAGDSVPERSVHGTGFAIGRESGVLCALDRLLCRYTLRGYQVGFSRF